MNRSRLIVGTPLFALLLCAGVAQAQTVTNLTVISGNGQVICQTCFGPTGSIQPLIVRVTDAAGAPLSGVSVSWSVTPGLVGGNLSSDTSTSDSNGYARANFFPQFPGTGTAAFASAQTKIIATAGASSATFTVTQGIQSDASQTGGATFPPLTVRVTPDSRDIVSGAVVSGQVGTTASTPFKIQVVTTQLSQPIANVGVMLYNELPEAGGSATSTIRCAEQAGAGRDTVLTDETGTATCSPIFGGTPNVDGHAYLVIGGAFPAEYLTDPTVPPASWVVLPGGGGRFIVHATPGTPSQVQVVSGDKQTAQAGQALAAPLVAQVNSQAGVGLAGQSVNWTVSPSAAATLGSTQTTTDTTGRTQNTLRFSATATGVVTVTASLASDATKTVSFTATAVTNVTASGLQIISGNNQSALANAAFGAPLVVQLNATSGPAVGIPVLFTITGPGTLSASTVNTSSTGQASVNVTAGNAPGNITVVASAAGFSQTFNLTVSPPGPSLSNNSFFNGADFVRGSLSPCSVATILAPAGLTPGLQGMVNGSPFGPLPYVLANIKVSVGGAAAPIYAVGHNANNQDQISFQVPCDVTPGSSVQVVVTINGAPGSANIPILVASPGIFQTVGSDGLSRAVVLRPDGTFVSTQNPARRGENLVAFVTGLGATNPPQVTNSVAPPNQVAPPVGTVIVGVAGGGVPLISTQLSPDLVGVWMVTFTVPSTVQATNNAVFSISVIPPGSNTPLSSGTSSIPVQ